MKLDSFVNAGSIEFVEDQYLRFLSDPKLVEEDWRRFFEQDVVPYDRGGLRQPSVNTTSIFCSRGAVRCRSADQDPGVQRHEPEARSTSVFPRGLSGLPDSASVSRTDVAAPSIPGDHAASGDVPAVDKMPQQVDRTEEDALALSLRTARVYQLVNTFRVRGHIVADLDPLDQRPLGPWPELEVEYYGFSEEDLERQVPNGGFFGPSVMKLRELRDALRETYCRTIGVEFMNIQDMQQKAWLQQRMETSRNHLQLTREDQLRILQKLAMAEGLEQFLHTKYLGTKRFSLEGAESLIPLLDLLMEHAGVCGVQEIVMGMAHRGRLNVLTNTLEQSPGKLFAKFEDADPYATLGSGDVKYHLGYSADLVTRRGHPLHITLSFNPSHLEAVNPVVEGRVRAKQDRLGDGERVRVLPVLIHGDAAFAGQGLVPETLNLAHLPGYRTGGTIHIIVNNQIGFTTHPSSSRSTPYPTDVAKMTQVPIFHVNGEDPEAVAQVVRLAMEFRQTFKKDVVIDMFCYRKYGHNESDEPSFTQPLMYKVIESHRSVHDIYTDRMLKSGQITQEEAQAIVKGTRERLEQELARARGEKVPTHPDSGRGLWTGYVGGADAAVPDVETGVEEEILKQIARKLVSFPKGFTPHRKIVRLLKQREAMGLGRTPLDWGMAEALALGSLVWESVPVRLSGQDSRRGTFSHRHAVLTDVNTGVEYMPLADLRSGQGSITIFDSCLSEAGVLGFDYGYSLDTPDGLVMWEAQFGDFANGAQVIIDQFLISAEDKWRRLSGLVLLLPHGYEGQGPEHSSARLERYLEACARDNIQVCNATTPAQIFHLLRRQVKRFIRKPLIVMTPKSLLRHPSAVSDLRELTTGRFQRILNDRPPSSFTNLKHLVLCSGKFYYELVEERERRGLPHLPILRVEQLYPFPLKELVDILERCPQVHTLVWAQEEPRNMGAWTFIRNRLLDLFEGRFRVRGFARAEAASPATGSLKAHQIEARMLLDEVFGSLSES